MLPGAEAASAKICAADEASRLKDVYKRQAEEMQREQERRTRQAGISYIKYIEAVRERQYGIMPVSYTHLDVYKRQAVNC